MSEIRYLDVCSGYSAFTLASAGLGFRCVGYSEIEPFPRAMLEQRHQVVAVGWDHRFAAGNPVIPLFGDFTRIEAHHVGPVDLLTGGTPCQAFSLAGLRGGLADARGNLTLEFLRLAERVRARWLLWENVPGVFSALAHDAPDPSPPAIDLDGDDGPEDGEEVVVEDEYDADESHALSCFLAGLSELGYGWAYRVLDAQYVRVDGHPRAVPQRRRRVFVVAHLGDEAGPATVLFEPESLRGDPAPRRETGEGIAGTVEASASGDRGSAGRTTDGRPATKAFGGWVKYGEVETSGAVTAHPGGRYDLDSETFVAQVAATLPAGGNATGGVRQPGMGAETAATMLVAAPIARTLTKSGERVAGKGYSGRRDEDDVNLVAHAFDARQRDVCQYGDISPPLDTDGYTVAVAHSLLAKANDSHAADLDTYAAHSLRADGFDASEDGTVRGTPIIPVYAINADCIDRSGEGAAGNAAERAGLGIQSGIAYSLRASRTDAVAFDTTQITSAANYSNPKPGDPCHPLARGQHPPAVAYSIMPQNSGKDYKAREVDVAQPLMAGGPVGGNQGGDYIAGHWAVRRLTPTECERLMGVPDGFTAIAWRGKLAADGPRYKVLGNSQAGNAMRWIAHGLADVIAAQREGGIA